MILLLKVWVCTLSPFDLFMSHTHRTFKWIHQVPRNISCDKTTSTFLNEKEQLKFKKSGFQNFKNSSWQKSFLIIWRSIHTSSVSKVWFLSNTHTQMFLSKKSSKISKVSAIWYINLKQVKPVRVLAHEGYSPRNTRKPPNISNK